MFTFADECYLSIYKQSLSLSTSIQLKNFDLVKSEIKMSWEIASDDFNCRLSIAEAKRASWWRSFQQVREAFTRVRAFEVFQCVNDTLKRFSSSLHEIANIFFFIIIKQETAIAINVIGKRSGSKRNNKYLGSFFAPSTPQNINFHFYFDSSCCKPRKLKLRRSAATTKSILCPAIDCIGIFCFATLFSEEDEQEKRRNPLLQTIMQLERNF